jgi:hypothetical protein
MIPAFLIYAPSPFLAAHRWQTVSSPALVFLFHELVTVLLAYHSRNYPAIDSGRGPRKLPVVLTVLPVVFEIVAFLFVRHLCARLQSNDGSNQQLFSLEPCWTNTAVFVHREVKPAGGPCLERL